MSAMKKPIFTYPVKAAAAFAQNLAVGYDGNIAAAGAAMLGVSASDAEIDVMLAVDVQGTSTAISGAAFAAGAELEVGVGGKLITKATGIAVARAIDAAVGADEICEVMLLPK